MKHHWNWYRRTFQSDITYNLNQGMKTFSTPTPYPYPVGWGWGLHSDLHLDGIRLSWNDCMHAALLQTVWELFQHEHTCYSILAFTHTLGNIQGKSTVCIMLFPLVTNN